MIRQELQTQNQESETAKEDHNLLDDEDQNLQNHEQTYSEPSNVIEVDGPREKRHERVISVRDKLATAHHHNTRIKNNRMCIYTIPRYLYENDKKSYFPQTVSIGPYHHGKEHLQAMESHKWRAVSMVLKRTKQEFGMYIKAMKKDEWWVPDSYEGPVSFRGNKFIEMMVVDGCFVLELLAGVYGGFSNLGYSPNDPVFAIRGLMHSIRRDMLMLENQIPFSVLCTLAKLQNRGLVVRTFADHFFKPLMPTSLSCTCTTYTCITTSQQELTTEVIITREESEGEALHCLHLFRDNLLVGISETPEKYRYNRIIVPLVADKCQQRMIHCVTELRDAGFNFRKRETDHFWDIQFKKGYLELPKLVIHEGTKSLFLNLIAFEQSDIYSSKHITSYIIFMDNLIDSAEDVHYLHGCGIIEHSLGSDSEVADLFNGLCHEVVFNRDDAYLSQLLKEVDRCYEQKYFRKWNTWTRTLKQKYFDNPWAYLSFLAAVLLLFLTFAQTYFAGYAYFKPSVP